MKKTFETIDSAELDNVIGGIALGPIAAGIGKKVLSKGLEIGKAWLAKKLSPQPQS